MAGSGRSGGDAALVAALAAGATVKDAAKQAHMSERTIYRRLSNPVFRQQIRDVRAELVERAVGALADAAGDAVTTLRGLLAAESESVQLGAARSILELGAKLREGAELEQRIADLEAAIGQEGRKKWA